MPNLNSPILTGDVSGGLHSTSVDKLKGQAVASTAPTSGQVLTWNGTAWAPATASTGGGGGANGLTYYLRFDQAADAPTTNLPGTPKQLGRTGAVAQSSVTSGTLTSGTWTLLAGFVSESVPIDPNITSIPGGLWDINAWALGTANQQSPTSIRAKIYTYDGANAPTLISTSGEQTINTVSAQYSMSALVPQTNVTSTTRIYIAIEVQSTANGHTATLQFGDGTPSHVHTSLPLVGGTGLWHSVAGVLQSPASLLVDADVDPSAAIAQSKIANLTTDLTAKAGTAQMDVYATAGTFTWTKPAGARAVNIQLLAGGGGGGSGRFSSTAENRSGGGGGGGGSYLNTTISASALGATVSVVIGAGGAGGAAQTSLGGNGLTGSAGSATTFDVYVATGGGGGIGGSTSGGGAGNAALNSNVGGAGSTTGGAGGGGNPLSIGVAWMYGGAGGAGGGGVNASNTQSSGGAGGRSNAIGLAGGALGVAGGGIGGAGLANASAASGLIASGSGGGGGGGSSSGAGGAGGSGGFPSGGGGGGGVGIATQSGAGGAGAAGMAVITTYF